MFFHLQKCCSFLISKPPSLFFYPIRASRFTNPFCGQGNFAPSDSSVAARLSSDNWSQLHWRKSSKVIENPYDRHRKSYDPRTPKAPRFLIESMESNQLSLQINSTNQQLPFQLRQFKAETWLVLGKCFTRNHGDFDGFWRVKTEVFARTTQWETDWTNSEPRCWYSRKPIQRNGCWCVLVSFEKLFRWFCRKDWNSQT